MPSNLTALQIQLELLRLIPKTRFITAEEILQKLADIGVQRDIRSIQRQLESLSQQFEIERDMRDIPILNEPQSLVLMLAKQYLNGILPSSIMSSMEAFFQQAEYNLVYDSHKKSGAEWLNKVAIAPTSQPLLPAKINPEIFSQISTALYQNRFL